MLQTLSNTVLAHVFNEAIENHSLPIAKITKFASKEAGIKRIEKIATEYGLTVEQVNDDVALVQVETGETPEAAKGMTDEQDAELAALQNADADEAAEDAKPAKKGKKAKKAKAAKPAKVAGKRGPAPEYKDAQVITVLMANPKRPGTAAFARYAKYVDGMTVAEAVEAGLRRDDFRWDIAHNHISIK
jgi:hypothetical protein